jgi:hypothetical protein
LGATSASISAPVAAPSQTSVGVQIVFLMASSVATVFHSSRVRITSAV